MYTKSNKLFLSCFKKLNFYIPLKSESSLSAFAQDDIYLGRAPAVDSSVTFDHMKNTNYPRDMPFEGTETSIASDDWHFNRPTLPRNPGEIFNLPAQIFFLEKFEFNTF